MRCVVQKDNPEQARRPTRWGTARYVKLRIAILNFPLIIVWCRQLSLTNLVTTADGRIYPSRPSANCQHVEKFVTANNSL